MSFSKGDRRCRDRMVVEFITTYATMQSGPITTTVVSSYLAHGEVHSTQHYVIKFVSDLRQVDGFSVFSTNKKSQPRYN